jgi:hypothetical protein
MRIMGFQSPLPEGEAWVRVFNQGSSASKILRTACHPEGSEGPLLARVMDIEVLRFAQDDTGKIRFGSSETNL